MATYSNDEIIVRPIGQKRSGGGIFLVILIILALVGFAIYWFGFRDDKPIQPAPSTSNVIVTETAQRMPANRFDDGLRHADTTRRFQLDDMGEGLFTSEIFNVDINSDGRPDRITRNRYENGTDHFYYDYIIELNTPNGYQNITPDQFRTIEGSECALRKIQFIFSPEFHIKVISRPWQESWTTPTMATLTAYGFTNNGSQLDILTQRATQRICDVSELF